MLASCRFKAMRCHQCGKIGHVKAACRSASHPAKGVKSLTAQEEQRPSLLQEESGEEYQLFAVDADDDEAKTPLTVQMRLDG